MLHRTVVFHKDNRISSSARNMSRAVNGMRVEFLIHDPETHERSRLLQNSVYLVVYLSHTIGHPVKNSRRTARKPPKTSVTAPATVAPLAANLPNGAPSAHLLVEAAPPAITGCYEQDLLTIPAQAMAKILPNYASSIRSGGNYGYEGLRCPLMGVPLKRHQQCPHRRRFQ